MSATITWEQRDALCDQILDHLSAIDDIEMAVKAQRYDRASRLAREYSDELLLLLGVLGFGDGGDGPVEPSTPPEVLRRVVPRMRDLAKGYAGTVEDRFAEAQEAQERSRLIEDACGTLLVGLDQDPGTS